MEEFKGFQKIPRLSRDMVITEKIDGTNAQVLITEDGEIHAGSRKRWITPESDNYGFARWVLEHKDELLHLGPGRHFGEWWGQGIQRKYDLTEKRFSLFNVHRWVDAHSEPPEDLREIPPACCHVVPILYVGPFCTDKILQVMSKLQEDGSHAAPGFMRPEGIVIYHIAGGYLFKKTFDGDDSGKGAE